MTFVPQEFGRRPRDRDENYERALAEMNAINAQRRAEAMKEILGVESELDERHYTEPSTK